MEINILKKEIKKDCGCTFEMGQPKQHAKKDCKSCDGSGELEDSIYYHIADGMCFDGDTIK